MKWALGAVALIAVVAIAVAVTVVVLHDSGGGSADGGGSGSASGIASANDTGPVAVITDEPTCDKFNTINNGLANQGKNGWNERDASIPATDWTPDQRAQYQAMGTTMRNTADQFVPLAKQTPHRVVRELYEQFIAYAHAYADSIPTYTASDDHLASVVTGAGGTLVHLCSAISEGSASAWGPSVPAAAPPSHPVAPSDLAHPQRFLANRETVCGDWLSEGRRYDTDTSVWRDIDSNIPATQRSPEQKAAADAVEPVMSSGADNVERIGRRSNNPTFEDFSVLSAQYNRAYVQALPTYGPSDSYLAATGSYAASTISAACRAVGG